MCIHGHLIILALLTLRGNGLEVKKFREDDDEETSVRPTLHCQCPNIALLTLSKGHHQKYNDDDDYDDGDDGDDDDDNDDAATMML